MRKIININQGWKFSKEKNIINEVHNASFESIDLPHTWNAIDGQDGGNDYVRGIFWYTKTLKYLNKLDNEKIFIEFQGVNSSATVYLNDKKLFTHHGGYSTFRVDLTDHLCEENVIAVEVDNSTRDDVYPQNADFTFYGGIYRDVSLIRVQSSHFDLLHHGGPGIKVTPKLNGKNARIEVTSYISGDYDDVLVTINDQDGHCVSEGHGNQLQCVINDAHLWDGLNNPYLYQVNAKLIVKDQIVDEVNLHFGCRTYEIDPNLGFILNGKPYPLRGVSRHQDFIHIGNALTKKHHENDMDLILEVGANSIRLAHYQHDAYFYDLCDKKGIVTWAEIPYISEHLPNGRENTFSQMKELIIQNYHRPSIVVWGLSNEISIRGYSDDLYDNHIALNKLCKELDPTRKTAMAAVTILSTDSPLLYVPDVVAYNHYFGWYSGEAAMNGPWFDQFHQKHPNVPIGFSEYGAEAVMNWQTERPKNGDYSEQYQAIFHESILEQIASRPYLWSTYVWNMFDFAADARHEGGENGMNHKGLVTFDHHIKKDAFYIYKAHWSKDPFVYITSRRYVKRHDEVTEIKVYSNQKEVSLYQNNHLIETQKGEYVFKFNIKLAKINHIVVLSKHLSDQIMIEKVDAPFQDYILKQTEVINWFETEAQNITRPEGYYSIFDLMSEVHAHPEASLVLNRLTQKVMESLGFGDLMPKKGQETEMSGEIQALMSKMTVQDSIRMTGKNLSKEFITQINHDLNQIKKL